MKQRLRWNGSVRAQDEADQAWRECQAKAKARAEAKAAARKQRRKRPKFVGTYHEYLKSPQWAKKKRQAHKHYGGCCTICNETQGLQVHHRHYRTLFREKMKDLDLLCAGCHSNHHEDDKGAIDPITARYLSLDL